MPNGLLIANHISWLDIPILGAQGELGFLSKSEVRGWPLIGWMAKIAGTRFIERGAHQSQAVLDRLLEDLSQGRSIMIFPEGTTTDGRGVSRFHPRLFALAQQPGIHVQPVAISYRGVGASGPDTQVPYVGEDTLIANLWRLIRHPGLVAHVRFMPPMRAEQGESRRALAERARSRIVEALNLESRHPDRDTPISAVETWPHGVDDRVINLDPRPL